MWISNPEEVREFVKKGTYSGSRMMTIEEYAKNALVNYGAALEDWKVKVLDVSGNKSSDWVTVTCTVTKKRCRKPFIIWDLKMNMARNIVDFEKSTFCYF